MNNVNSIKIIQPDDWHTHLREGDMLKAVINCSTRINYRCVVMPNLKIPITNSELALKYKKNILTLSNKLDFVPLLPCYLTEDLDLKDFRFALKNEIFFGAKLYPSNVTTNSQFGISKIEKIFLALEILSELNKPLLIHGEKSHNDIDIFDREKYFIDDELTVIREKFPKLKIVLEHVSSKYGADYVNNHSNIAGTITPHHMILTKKDVFLNNDNINFHNYCMPVVKEEKDLVSLRNYASSGNNKFFIGTDSAPHHIDSKKSSLSMKPGIFSAPSSIELYANIFSEENSIHNLENFTSINGPRFYELPINSSQITLKKEKWKIPKFTIYKGVKIQNFMGGKEINWKVAE